MLNITMLVNKSIKTRTTRPSIQPQYNWVFGWVPFRNHKIVKQISPIHLIHSYIPLEQPNIYLVSYSSFSKKKVKCPTEIVRFWIVPVDCGTITKTNRMVQKMQSLNQQQLQTCSPLFLLFPGPYYFFLSGSLCFRTASKEVFASIIHNNLTGP